MYKKTLVMVLTVVFSLAVSSTAFAYHSGKVTYFNDGQSGWVSNGHHGHYWSGDIGDRYVKDRAYIVVKGVHYGDWDRCYYCYNDSRWYRYGNKDGKVRYYYDWDRDGEWYYYKDDNGKSHYFYIDPDRDGKWHRYRDGNGNIQYYYKVNQLNGNLLNGRFLIPRGVRFLYYSIGKYIHGHINGRI